ncbi:hypothetical protein HanIR_Chr14g0715041 [Helianthus annuus]|nr:hypothetical protein HanIR_Chr14g0715041 [Helianthus annuus]
MESIYPLLTLWTLTFHSFHRLSTLVPLKYVFAYAKSMTRVITLMDVNFRGVTFTLCLL